MPLFSAPTPLELAIDKATSETNTSEDWNLILDICDQVRVDSNLPKECLKYLMKRMSHANPHVVLYSLTLLDACVNNCGKRFHLEVCSREFETEFKRCLQRQVQPKVIERMLTMIKKWAELKEFKDDPQLTLIPTLYRSLMKEYRFPTSTDTNGASKSQAKLPTDPNVVTSNQEEEDIAKAIELSLKESGGSSPPSKSKTSSGLGYKKQESNSFYPIIDSNVSVNSPSFSGVPSGKDPYQVRALYDFEAAEDNELTFKAGEVVVVLDDSDTNWWKGSNHRGEGLFPANFVTTDLTEPTEQSQPMQRKSVQFNDEVKVTLLEKEVSEPVSIDEEKIDRLIHLLHEADPTNENRDSEELISLEEQCSQMGPMIDEELEKVDRKIAALNGVNGQLVEAMNLYHSLMRESLAPGISPYYPSPIANSQPVYPGQQAPYPPSQGSPAQYSSHGYSNSHPGYSGHPPVDPGYGHQHQPMYPVYQQQTNGPHAMPQYPPVGHVQQQPQQYQQHPPPPAAFATPSVDQHPPASMAPNM